MEHLWSGGWGLDRDEHVHWCQRCDVTLKVSGHVLRQFPDTLDGMKRKTGSCSQQFICGQPVSWSLTPDLVNAAFSGLVNFPKELAEASQACDPGDEHVATATEGVRIPLAIDWGTDNGTVESVVKVRPCYACDAGTTALRNGVPICVRCAG